jgi:hypothetical protein
VRKDADADSASDSLNLPGQGVDRQPRRLVCSKRPCPLDLHLHCVLIGEGNEALRLNPARRSVKAYPQNPNLTNYEVTMFGAQQTQRQIGIATMEIDDSGIEKNFDIESGMSRQQGRESRHDDGRYKSFEACQANETGHFRLRPRVLRKSLHRLFCFLSTRQKRFTLIGQAVAALVP